MLNMDSSLIKKVVKRLLETEEALGSFSQLLPEQNTEIHYHLLHMQKKGLGVPQDNKYARALEALREAEKKRRDYS